MTKSMEAEVLKGLSHNPKYISSKFLYDEKGSQIFQEISAMPSYYPYRAEYEIMKSHGKSIFKVLPFNESFSIVEFGAGDGSKTAEFLKQIPFDSYFDRYIPVDISAGANGVLTSMIAETIPGLSVAPIQGNYLKNMGSLIPHDQPVLLLYLGSNIGNFQFARIRELMMNFGRYLNTGDAVLIGFDLRKNPLTIRRAYDDPEGITRSFNMNLLVRFNRELNTDFDLSGFDFYSYYHPQSGEVRSYLVSLVDQEVRFPQVGSVVKFTRHELVYTEVSKKFNFDEIYNLLDEGGFRKLDHWMDSNEYFADVLAVKE